MLAKVYSYGIIGLEAYPVTIEVDVSGGLPCTVIVGLPDNAVKESKERVRSAIKNSGYKFEPQRITINLSPADTKKEGPCFDLAMALGILAATEQIPAIGLNQYLILGELSLDGKVQPVSGCLPIALSLKENSYKGIIIPVENAAETAVADHIKIFPVATLHEAIHLISGLANQQPFKTDLSSILEKSNSYDVDFSDVKGQSIVKRGLEIAAAGGHNVLLIGPPGSGKSMMAKRLSSILPDMTWDEMLETTKIHSIVNLLKPTEAIVTRRPFRAPHHTTSSIAIVGGGSIPKPGEVTLSHNGVLFLDELPEFSRGVLEALRQPLEDHCVTIARANKSCRFPSQFMLVAAMNPCPCGWYTDSKKQCHCTGPQVQKYLSKISGPLLDRIDIHLEVPALPSTTLLSQTQAETSEQIKIRTSSARALQQERLGSFNIFSNAQMNHKQVKQFCGLNDECKKILKMAIEELGLSARAYDKILKVSRTIADLDGATCIEATHISEAIQYRYLDRNWWG